MWYKYGKGTHLTLLSFDTIFNIINGQAFYSNYDWLELNVTNENFNSALFLYANSHIICKKMTVFAIFVKAVTSGDIYIWIPEPSNDLCVQQMATKGIVTSSNQKGRHRAPNWLMPGSKFDLQNRL